MVTTQAQRAVLRTKLVELMDQEAADILMDQLPPAGWEQMATKDDLANTEQRLQAALQTAMAETNMKFAEVYTVMQAGFAEAARERAVLAAGLAEVKAVLAVVVKDQADLAAGLAETNRALAKVVEDQAVLAAGLAETNRALAKVVEDQAVLAAGLDEVRAVLAVVVKDQAVLAAGLAETNAALERYRAEASMERAKIVRAQARQLFAIAATFVASTASILIALVNGAGA